MPAKKNFEAFLGQLISHICSDVQKYTSLLDYTEYGSVPTTPISAALTISWLFRRCNIHNPNRIVLGVVLVSEEWSIFH